MRVNLPVYPHLKIESEVVTGEFAEDRRTKTLLSRKITFDSDFFDELGIEWIIMDMMPGVTLRNRWTKTSWEAKKTPVPSTS
jgi:hypothetical protein